MQAYKSIIGLVLIGGVLAIWVPPLLVLGLVLLTAAVVFLSRRLDFGLLILVFFFPYLGLMVDFGGVGVLRSIPYLKNVNAPFVDLYGLVLFAAWILNLGLRYIHRHSEHSEESSTSVRKSHIRERSFVAPLLRMTKEIHFKSYLLFWLSGLISLSRVSALNFAGSLKYFARPFTFFYLVFFAMPVSILTSSRHPERSEGSRATHDGRDSSPAKGGGRMTSLAERVLWVFYWTGLLSAFNGLLGLFFGEWAGFPRATPFAFFGVNPLGPNHNLLAETLIATAPAGLILMSRHPERSEGSRATHDGRDSSPAKGGGRMTDIVRYGMFFQWAIALLTFARTAWIAIFVQAVIYGLCELGIRNKEFGGWWKRLRMYLGRYKTGLVALLLFFAVFAGTIFTYTVQESTSARFEQARIAGFYFLRSPWIGQGVGTFIPILWQTEAFVLEYGEPLDAHGILLKLIFEQGLLGIAAFVIFAGSILYGIIKGYNQTAKSTREQARTCIMVALLIAAGSLAFQLFNTTYYTSKLWIPLAIAFVLSKKEYVQND